MEKTLFVQGMSCNHCKSAVEGALTKLDGVSNAEADINTGKVNIFFDDSKVNMEVVKEAIEEQGYDVEA